MNPFSIPYFRPLLCAWSGLAVPVVLVAQSAPAWRFDLRRVPLGPKIVVDGRLDDPGWRGAASLSALTQVEPIEGAKPHRATKVRISYDRDFLYLAIECDDDPELVRGRIMRRDARLDADDRVEFWFDTFHDRRFGYWFQIGAGGSKGDALIGGGSFNKSWDGIWHGRSRVTDHGWQAEVAIPFKTLAFKLGSGRWGFNLRRLRKENDAEYRWAAPLVAYRFFSLVQGGILVGFEGIRQGIGLDLVPYYKAGVGRDRTVDKHSSVHGEFGLDANYRLGPSVNLRVTYNTDFAETEVDQRQANLTRFPLFFPEKRDFFLEDAGMFEFGAPSRRGGDVIPFFSRRIGRDANGAAIPIVVGAKLTGRTDDWNFGVLEVYQDEHRDADGKFSDARGLGVMRVSRNLGRESSIGVIAASGSPTDSGAALTAGLDLHLSDSTAFGPGNGYDLIAWWVGTSVGGAGGDDDAYGMRLNFLSKEWRTAFTETHVGNDFAPKLGFVRRTGVRKHRVSTEYTWRSANGSLLRRYQSRLSPTYTTTEDGSLDSWAVPLKIAELTLSSDDSISYEIHRIHERLREDFEISDGVILGPGDYTTTNHFLELETAKSRWGFLQVKARFGGFYTGSLSSVELRPTLILGRHFNVSLGYQENHVALNEGNFTTRVMSGRFDVAVSPELTWRNLLQYDGGSKNLSAQSRLRWIYRPGQELFLVGLYGWEKAEHSAPLLPTTQEIAMKLQYTMRF